jgi:hypothetical protein
VNSNILDGPDGIKSTARKLVGVSPMHILRCLLRLRTFVEQNGIASVGIDIYKLNTAGSPDAESSPSTDCINFPGVPG